MSDLIETVFFAVLAAAVVLGGVRACDPFITIAACGTGLPFQECK